jgi:hypothetical protein
VVSATDPYDRNLGFLDRSRYFSFKLFLSCTHDSEWTPFQTHYYSENVVAAVVEPGPLDLYVPWTLTTRPQRRSTFFYITYINSVHTSQETKYISVV